LVSSLQQTVETLSSPPCSTMAAAVPGPAPLQNPRPCFCISHLHFPCTAHLRVAATSRIRKRGYQLCIYANATVSHTKDASPPDSVLRRLPAPTCWMRPLLTRTSLIFASLYLPVARPAAYISRPEIPPRSKLEVYIGAFCLACASLGLPWNRIALIYCLSTICLRCAWIGACCATPSAVLIQSAGACTCLGLSRIESPCCSRKGCKCWP
jgi:hypothetical protein